MKGTRRSAPREDPEVEAVQPIGSETEERGTILKKSLTWLILDRGWSAQAVASCRVSVSAARTQNDQKPTSAWKSPDHVLARLDLSNDCRHSDVAEVPVDQMAHVVADWHFEAEASLS